MNEKVSSTVPVIHLIREVPDVDAIFPFLEKLLPRRISIMSLTFAKYTQTIEYGDIVIAYVVRLLYCHYKKFNHSNATVPSILISTQNQHRHSLSPKTKSPT